MKIIFITGARSDYGPIRSVLEKVSLDKKFQLDILVHGMQLLEEFGSSHKEISADGFGNVLTLKTIESETSKAEEFLKTIDTLNDFFRKNRYDLAMVLGDRLETYAAALSLHFNGLPIMHFGGGHITTGSLDNIYRYGITGLSKYHLPSSKKSYENLMKMVNVHKDHVYLTGSPTVDKIQSFLKQKKSDYYRFNIFNNKKYALMSFHPSLEDTRLIIEIMRNSIDFITQQNLGVFITYPNNDEGSKEIINYIESIKNQDVYSAPHLGSTEYYQSMHDSEFVIGNSSSGIIEAPYFNKPVINVGDRQNGRAKNESIVDVNARVDDVLNSLKEGFLMGWPDMENHYVYGKGNCAADTIRILLEIKKCN